MDGTPRINAIAGPTPSEFPSGPPFLGIVMLQTRFPRPLGDIGNPQSFGVPARLLVVPGAVPGKVVQTAEGLRAAGLLEPFRRAVAQLEREGAAAITTSCGFLALLQDELQARVQVPVVTSSLCLLPGLLEVHRQVGVLTISAERLGLEFLSAAGVEQARLADVIVEGVDAGGEFATAILGDRESLDIPRAAVDVVAAATALKRRAPHLTELVLECTNMPPYARAIEQATGLRTWSLLQSRELLAPFA